MSAGGEDSNNGHVDADSGSAMRSGEVSSMFASDGDGVSKGQIDADSASSKNSGHNKPWNFGPSTTSLRSSTVAISTLNSVKFGQ